MAEGARLESVFTGNRNVGSNPTPSATSRRARLSAGTLPREYARNLQHPENDLCTSERGLLPNPFSRALLSLELCTFAWRYGFEAPFKTGVFWSVG